MKNWLARTTFTLICLTQPNWAFCAAHTSPFQFQNQSPLILAQGLPIIDHAPYRDFTHHIRYTINVSNSLNRQTSENENLLFDYELRTINILYDRNLNHTWSLGLSVPLLSYAEGSLDNFIEEFHDFFGFRRGNRPYYAQNQFNLNYTRNGTTRLNMTEPESGLGDISASLKRTLSHSKDSLSTFTLQLKLPSGDSDKLSGSGSTNLSAAFAISHRLSKNVSSYTHIGAILLSQGDILPEQQETSTLFANTTLEWKPFQKTSFKVQLDGHTQFYKDTSLPLLGDSLQIAVGGSYYFSDKTILDIAVGEDIKVSASADVNFHFALRKSY